MDFHKYFKTFLESGFVSRNHKLILFLIFGTSFTGNVVQYLDVFKKAPEVKVEVPAVQSKTVTKVINQCGEQCTTICKNIVKDHERREH